MLVSPSTIWKSQRFCRGRPRTTLSRRPYRWSATTGTRSISPSTTTSSAKRFSRRQKMCCYCQANDPGRKTRVWAPTGPACRCVSGTGTWDHWCAPTPRAPWVLVPPPPIHLVHRQLARRSLRQDRTIGRLPWDVEAANLPVTRDQRSHQLNPSKWTVLPRIRVQHPGASSAYLVHANSPWTRSAEQTVPARPRNRSH